jgi:hypothetical protein
MSALLMQLDHVYVVYKGLYSLWVRLLNIPASALLAASEEPTSAVCHSSARGNCPALVFACLIFLILSLFYFYTSVLYVYYVTCLFGPRFTFSYLAVLFGRVFFLGLHCHAALLPKGNGEKAFDDGMTRCAMRRMGIWHK